MSIVLSNSKNDISKDSLSSENTVFDNPDYSCAKTVDSVPAKTVEQLDVNSDMKPFSVEELTPSEDEVESIHADQKSKNQHNSKTQIPDSQNPSPEQISKDDQDQKAVDNEIWAHSSAKTTFFPTYNYTISYLDNNDETLSNTNANARTYQAALEESRRRRDRNLRLAQRGVFIADFSDTDDSDGYSSDDEEDQDDLDHQHINIQKETDRNTKENEILGDAVPPSITYTRPHSPRSNSLLSSANGLRSRSRTRSRTRSRSRNGSRVYVDHPADEFSRGVSFDTYNNKYATDFSLTLSYKHRDYHNGSLSRTFMVGTDNNKYSDNAATWLFQRMIDDGDQIICLRVVEPGTSEKTYRKKAQDFLQHILAKNVHNKRVSVTMEVAVGKVQDLIMRMTEIYSPSLLIVGTRGRSSKGFRGLLPGSISKWCLTHAPIPVVVVKPLNLRHKQQLARREKVIKQQGSVINEEGSAYANQHIAYMDMLADSLQFADMDDNTLVEPNTTNSLSKKEPTSTPLKNVTVDFSSTNSSTSNSFTERNGRKIYFDGASSKDLHPKIPLHFFPNNTLPKEVETQYNSHALSRKSHHNTVNSFHEQSQSDEKFNTKTGLSNSLQVPSELPSIPTSNIKKTTSNGFNKIETSQTLHTRASSPFRYAFTKSPRMSPKHSPLLSPLLSPSLKSTNGTERISRLDLLKPKRSIR